MNIIYANVIASDQYPHLYSSPLEGEDKRWGDKLERGNLYNKMGFLPPNACLPREIQSISGTLVLEITS
jgi:hypothetical protein